SEGGMIAPMVAAECSDVSFIVLLAGPGTPGDAILLAQGKMIVKAMGGDEKAMGRQQSIQQKLFALIKDGTDEAKLQVAMPDLAESLSGAEKAAVRAQVSMVASPWFKYFLSYDP